MQYRPFGPLEWEVSALGFGTMRLPVIDDDRGRIDESEATRMIRYAIDHGVNYVDTAYPYHEEACEPFLGCVLQDGYRERVKLATKLPTWLIESEADFDRFLERQLTRLQTDHIEFYLLHGLNRKRWPLVRDLGVLSWAEDALSAGSIGHLGFSFHDEYDLFKEIVDATALWTFCQIQYNFMDVDFQAGTRGLRYAAERGLGVVVMEPIRGGQVTSNIPPSIQRIWDGAPARRTPAEFALQWVWDQPEVAVVLSGMSLQEQVEQNIESACRSTEGRLTDEERDIVARVREEYRRLCPIPCTACGYCLPCPQGVRIPQILALYNEMVMYSDTERAQFLYGLLGEDERADLCIECGECVEKCPQQIEIPGWLARAQEVLSP
jgi:predicted aldo/keto reductase-like oxidoreductase